MAARRQVGAGIVWIGIGLFVGCGTSASGGIPATYDTGIAADGASLADAATPTETSASSTNATRARPTTAP